MAFTKTWDETKPDGSELANTLDTIIQDLKVAIRERLDVEHEFKTDGTGSMIHKQITIGTTPNSDDMYAFKSLATPNSYPQAYFRIISECTINGVTGSALTYNARLYGTPSGSTFWRKDRDSASASAILLSTGAVYVFTMPSSSTNWYNSWLSNDPTNVMRGVTEVLTTYFANTDEQTIYYFPVYIENASEQRIKAKLVLRTGALTTFRLKNTATGATLASTSSNSAVWAGVSLDGVPDTTGTLLVSVTAQPNAAPINLFTLLGGWFVGVS